MCMTKHYGLPMGYVVGITVRVKDGRPVLRGVVLDVSSASVRTFSFESTKGADPENHLHDLADALTAQLKVQPILAGVLLEAGFAPRAGLTLPNKMRLRAEGVALNVLRTSTPNVSFGDKRILGGVLSLSASELVEKGQTLAKDPWSEAAGAALVAVRIAEQ